MLGPTTVLMTALVVASVVGGVHAAPCTDSSPACKAKREEFLSQFSRTAGCMIDGARARVRQGERDEFSIGHTIVNACGQEFHGWLRRDGGFTDDEAVDVLDHLTFKAVREALAEAPQPHPKQKQKPKPQSAAPSISAQSQEMRERTAACLRSRVVHARLGNVRADALRSFLVENCASALHRRFMDQEGLTEDQSFTIIDRMVDDALAADREAAAPKSKSKPPAVTHRRENDAIQYDPQQEQRRGMFQSYHAQTLACMREAAVMWLRNDIRSRKDLSDLVVGICGGPIVGWLTAPPPRGDGMPEKQARAYVVAMSYEAINMALRGPDAIIIR